MVKSKVLTVKKNGAIRKNANGTPNIDLEDLVRYTTGRYVDPLVLNKFHNKQVAMMREVVAEADPIASVLTHHFSEASWAKMPKFYESDQLDSPEIMQDLRAMLKLFKFQEYGKDVFLKGQTHGWWIMYPFVDEETQVPLMEIYSEYECEAKYIHYDLQNNILWYQIVYIPRVGFSRQTNLRQVNRHFAKEQVMHGTRGTWRYGFGYSVLESSWDAITKLREESHTNAFKQKIMPIVRVPDEWEKEQINEFMTVLSKMDTMSGMVLKAAIDPGSGEYSDLPTVNYATPANQTPSKSGQGGGGSVSDLSSEWSRLTAATRRSVAYFVGGGALSASRAAAGVDSLDDVDEDIIDFNLYIDEFIIPFVRWFAELIGYTLPDSFTVKGWWEWTRDEALYNKVLQEQQQQEAAMAKIQGDQLSNADRKNLRRQNMKYSHSALKKISEAHPELQSKFETDDDFITIYHTDTAERIKQFEEEGYIPSDTFWTINRPNKFGEKTISLQIEKERAKEMFAEDPAEENGELVESEWLSHDQIYALEDLDFTSDPDIKKHNPNNKSESKGDSDKTPGEHSKFWGVYGSHKKQGESDQQAYENTKRELNNSMDKTELLSLMKDLARLPDTNPQDQLIQNKLNQKLKESTDPQKAAMDVVKEIVNEHNNQIVQANLDYCIRNNLNMPMAAVASSTVKGVGLFENKVLVEYHNPTSQGHSKYAYDLGSEEKAQQSWSDLMQATSKGGYIWDNFRGDKIGPAYGTGSPTPGGTYASLVPYEPYTRNPVGFIGAPDRATFEEQASELQKFKMESVGPSGSVLGSERYAQPEARGFQSMQPSVFYTEAEMRGGEPSTRDPNLTQAPSTSPMQQTQGLTPMTTIGEYKGLVSDNPSTQTSAKPAYAAGSFIYGPTGTPQAYEQRPKGMKTKTEATTGGMGIDDTMGGFPSIWNVSAKNIKPNIGFQIDNPKEIDPKFYLHPLLQQYGSAYAIRKNLHIGDKKVALLLEEEDKDCDRINMAALATAMNTQNPFVYRVGDGYRIEYICPDSLKQLEGVEVPFGVWHNLDNEESATLPDWQIIGTYKVDSITGEKDLSTIKYFDDWESRTSKILDKLKETAYYHDKQIKDWVDHYIENVKKGVHGDISTGIVTDVKYSKEKNKWIQTNIRLKSVSAVPMGNCTKPFCATKNLQTAS